MLREITLTVEENPIADRVAADLAAYTRWMETMQAFGQGDWSALLT